MKKTDTWFYVPQLSPVSSPLAENEGVVSPLTQDSTPHKSIIFSEIGVLTNSSFLYIFHWNMIFLLLLYTSTSTTLSITCAEWVIKWASSLTFDGVTETAFWFQASPASNRFFLEETGSVALVRSVGTWLPDLPSFEETCGNKYSQNCVWLLWLKTQVSFLNSLGEFGQ